MTILQIRVVILTAELGSITAAAKRLNVSQPNASNSIKLLEDEVGFPIFHRTGSGVVLTQKGEKFLNHARQILEQNEKIMGLRGEDEIYRLHIGGVNYSTCIGPFLELCKAHRDDRNADFLYFNVSVDEGVSGLLKRELDVVIAPILKHQVSGLVSKCSQSGISMNSLCKIPAVLDVREDHPAILDGRCKNIAQGSDAMKDFPYVAFRNLASDTGSTGYNDSDFAQCSYKIYVDDVDLRLRTVAATNGFAFGARSSDSVLRRYGLVSFPVPGFTLEAFVLTRPGEAERREIKEYLQLLKEEMKTVSVEKTF